MSFVETLNFGSHIEDRTLGALIKYKCLLA